MFILGLLLAVLTMFFAFLALTAQKNDFVYGVLAMVFGLISMSVLEIAVSEYSCNKTWSMSNTPSDYDMFTGCMIKIDDKWIPSKNYREFEE